MCIALPIIFLFAALLCNILVTLLLTLFKCSKNSQNPAHIWHLLGTFTPLYKLMIISFILAVNGWKFLYKYITHTKFTRKFKGEIV